MMKEGPTGCVACRRNIGFAVDGSSGSDYGGEAPTPIVAAIDVQQTASPVSKNEFDMFIEHIG